jgi:uncharacterized membrane protein YidH (DUF202 family)
MVICGSHGKEVFVVLLAVAWVMLAANRFYRAEAGEERGIAMLRRQLPSHWLIEAWVSLLLAVMS